MSVYERIEELRRKAGISQGKLERELGFSNGSISKWKNSTPSYARLEKLADFFGVSLDDLLDRTDVLSGKDCDAQKKEPFAGQSRRTVTDDDIMFALWGDTRDVDASDLDDVKRYADFIRERKKNK